MTLFSSVIKRLAAESLSQIGEKLNVRNSEGERSDIRNFVIWKPDGEILQEQSVGKKFGDKNAT